MLRRLLIASAAGLLAPVLAQEAENSSIRQAWDVVVVGAGGAGLAAALAAAQKGCSVLLVEKEDAIGGDTLISGGYFNAVDPARQKHLKEPDSIEHHLADTLSSAKGSSSQPLDEVFVREAPATLAWLEAAGMKFMPSVSRIFGGGFARSHKPLSVRGTGYVTVLARACLGAKVELRRSNAMRDLVLDSGQAVAVEIEGRERGSWCAYARRGIILACGGFGGNPEMVAASAPELAGLQTDAKPCAAGDAHRILAAHGIVLSNMPFVECVPGNPLSGSYPLRLDYNPERMILVNREGLRFVDERASRDVIRDAILRQPGKFAYSLTTASNVASFDILDQKHLYQGYFAGSVYQEDCVEAMASRLRLPLGNLRNSLQKLERIESEHEPFFPLWAVGVVLKIHTTLGGAAVDPEMRCLNAAGQPVGGLFAAGELIGNLHGANRLGGNGISAAMTTGRLAGLRAASSPERF